MMSQVSQYLLQSEQFFQGLGGFGVLVYALMIVLLQMVCVPLSVFAIGAGLMFGVGRGFVAVELGTALGAAVNFLLARYFARGPVSRWLGQHEKFRLIDAAIGREGGKIIALLRFCPIPYGIANYSYGLTAVGFGPYMLATVLAIIPANFFFVWFGASSHDALSAVSGTGPAAPGKMIFTVVGLVAFFAALTYVTKVARAAVAKGAPSPALEPEK